ncbi:MAG: type II secretion system F family protein, partial [Nitrospiraceae bacterium]
MTVAITIGVFLSIILFVEGGYYCYHEYLNPKHRSLKRRLRGNSARPDESPNASAAAGILRQRKLSDLPWLNSLLASKPTIGGIEKLLQQANSQLPLGGFLLLSGVLGGGILVVCAMLNYKLSVGLGGGLVGTFLPLIWMKRKRTKRFKEFERQLPEALDLMARALRAGHAFSVGMKMVGDEFSDPIGPEFGR